MKKEIADQWIAALRSGDYRQGQRALRNSDNEFCCLGVLCNLHAQAHPEIAAQQTNAWFYLGRQGSLADQVQEWAGIRSPLGEVWEDGESVIFSVEGIEWYCLSDANDGGCGFVGIADAIEKNWEKL